MSEHQDELLNNPYGQVSYETFRDADLAIADKTDVIKALDDSSMSPYPVLLCPRRFGKSTFVQMLKCFYDISYKDRYEEIFSGKDIYKENISGHNTYHVIDFDFSGVSGEDKSTLVDSFIIAIKRGITNFVLGLKSAL
ncbi:AAA family ATPase [Succinimonas amylolytica]|uniref:AAA family ATPase n=1 Tax=Succinimonas amylolytica TaxID=83769 RepID=UPI00035E3DE4|nr:AAA family ATPase [Succinimonas amylolytica]